MRADGPPGVVYAHPEPGRAAASTLNDRAGVITARSSAHAPASGERGAGAPGLARPPAGTIHPVLAAVRRSRRRRRGSSSGVHEPDRHASGRVRHGRLYQPQSGDGVQPRSGDVSASGCSSASTADRLAVGGGERDPAHGRAGMPDRASGRGRGALRPRAAAAGPPATQQVHAQRRSGHAALAPR